MKLVTRLFLLLMIGLAEACSVDESPVVCSDAIVFRLSLPASSRVSVLSDGSGEFQKGDRVALWVSGAPAGELQGKVVLQYDGGRWLSSLLWSDYAEAPHFFAAWPPDVEVEARDGTCWYVHRISTDQSEGQGYADSDLLLADAAGDGHSVVSLGFRHAMSRIRVTLTNADAVLSQEDAGRVKVYVHGYLSGVCAIDGPEIRTTDETGWILTRRLSDTFCFEALAFPGGLARFRRDGWVKIVIGDKEVVYQAPEEVGEALESGKQVAVNLTLKRAEDVQMPSVWWTDGVRPSDGWQYEEPVCRMPWTEGCGWFDCNKLDASDGSAGGDGRTCWEASASNLMHWWMGMNRVYVDRYVERRRKSEPDFAIPQAYPDAWHSAVYRRFKERFGNRSGYIVSGVNWFLSGICGQKMYPQNEPELEGAGFFFDVFGRNSLTRRYGNGYISKEDFNLAMRTAVKHGMAVGMDIFIQGGGHAVNLWGAEFDGLGEVKTVYLVDNNDGALGSWIYKAKIVYMQDTPGGAPVAYMKWMYNESLLVKVIDLVLVDRGLSYWDSYFAGNPE